MEAYAYLHSPYVKSLKETVLSGAIGKVDFINTAFLTQGYKEDNTNSRYDRLFIHGDCGVIRSEVEYNQEGEVSYRIITGDGVTEKKVTVPHNYALEVEQMGRCIRGEEKPHITAAFSIKNAKLIDSVLKEIGY